MSWSDSAGPTRRALLGTVGALVLSGCGFSPAFGTDGPGTALFDRTVISVPQTVAGYRLAERLTERLGTAPDVPVYDLMVFLGIDEAGVAVTPAGAITRFTLTGRSDFTLRVVGTDDILLSGDVEAFTGYSATDSTVATQTARDDATERLTRILADLIVTRLLTAPGL